MAIKLVKLYAWEKSFAQKIFELRRKEAIQLYKLALTKSLNLSFVFASPILIALAIFGTYIALGSQLSASNVFITISLFNILRFPLTMLPLSNTNEENKKDRNKNKQKGIKYASEAKVTLDRFSEFLLKTEVKKPTILEDFAGVKIKKASFRWIQSETVNLKNLSLKIPEQSLVAIVGELGSGKSNLLSAIIG
jgi:ABC-type multidrug transport system fused ATPase/permease subunit